jgi:multicomponent K+:H+ antiporter subunit G
MNEIPVWAQCVVAVLVIAGGLFALAGSWGLLRLRSFFQRVHSPTLGSTAGVWSISLANAAYFSVQSGQFFVHAMLIALFVAMTTPITTIFLMRTALFRERLAGADVPPTVSRD